MYGMRTRHAWCAGRVRRADLLVQERKDEAVGGSAGESGGDDVSHVVADLRLDEARELLPHHLRPRQARDRRRLAVPFVHLALCVDTKDEGVRTPERQRWLARRGVDCPARLTRCNPMADADHPVGRAGLTISPRSRLRRE